MQVPLLDLKNQFNSFSDELMPAIQELCASQQFILGPKVTELEKSIANYCQSPFALGVSSGSDALLIALMAENIGAGDEVITSSFTFFATAGAIARTGATPVFVDIDLETFNLIPEQVEKAVSSKTKAIIPVHLFGQAADMEPIMAVAERYGLIVIEDACQSIGAKYKDKTVGTIGDYGCLSFFPSKNLGCFGDGGMVLCKSEEKFERLKILRNHGMFPQYHHQIIGGNFRIDALQALVLLKKLPLLDSWSDSRQRNFNFYNDQFKNVPGLITPTIAPYATRHVGNQYSIRVLNGKRDALMNALKEAGVGCAIYYPIPLHCQECFSYLGYAPEQLPNSLRASQECLALPVFPELTHIQKDYVVKTILENMERI